MPECEQIGDATLYCGDCLEILPTLGVVDAVVTDPPYGIGAYSTGIMGAGVLARQSEYEPTTWDTEPVSEELRALVLSAAQWCVWFGGNYYAMPPSSCWLVWDKINGTNNFADCELAWTNLRKAVRLVRYRWHGMLRANNETRGDHPTQKPIGVMEWAIEHLPADAKTILDPFMGSGTTGVACANLGRKFIGIEIERKYFDIACERISAAYAQCRLFA